ncbi:SPASM domain-containing protein [Candidatus Woesearchaeota archaeon]|nr:SPASM domain-containing protein [Candidatus Woesearchaeota archaeon]MCF7901393.1 SPASM domain-containing protein [Candidatus Woesearchaeota archaeon]MCF8013733.1 SPASM domain-containing protein [Candidatus Woesearchaeota archaeon]
MNSENKIDQRNDLDFKIVEIETHSTCNRTCSYCPNSIYDRGKKKNEVIMSEKMYEKILLELSNFKFEGQLRFHLYNEPLLDKRLPNFIAKAHDILPKSKKELFTNGDLLSEKKLDELKYAGIDKILVTIHEGTLSTNLKNIDHIVKEKNLGRLVHIRKYEEISLLNRGGLLDVTSKKQTSCFYASERLVISSKGDILICSNDYLGKIKLGNLHKSSIQEIWNLPQYKKLRRNLREGIFEYDMCKICMGQT